MGQSQGETQYKLPDVLSQCSSTGALHSLAMMYDSTCEVLPTREAHQSLGVQGFYWGSVTKGLQHSYQGKYFKVSELISQELAKGQS